MDNVLDLEVQFNGLQMGDTFLVDLDVIGTPFRGPPGRDGTNGTDGAPGTDGEDGTNGTDGREVELQLSGGWVQWRYVNDPDWINIISVASLVGPEGPAGTDGSDGTDGLNGTDGEDGRSVELQLSATHIQWRLVGNIPWLDLVPLASITGPAGANGNDGADGTNGTDGNDGREVQLRSDSGWIQWRYVDDVAWTNLVSEDSLTGPAGTDGTDGVDGPAIELNVSATHIQWRVVGSPTWIDLIALSALIGPEGPAGADGADGVGSSVIEVIAGTSYNLLAVDVNKYLLFTAATPKTLTVRPDATEALPVNGEWHVRNRGAGNITLTAGAGVTLNTPTGGNLIVPTGGTVTLKRTAINVFDVIGVTQAATVLGDAAFKNTGTAAGTVAAGDDARIANALRSDLGGTVTASVDFTTVTGIPITSSRYGSGTSANALILRYAHGTSGAPTGLLTGESTVFLMQGYAATQFRNMGAFSTTLIEPTPSDTMFGCAFRVQVPILGGTSTNEVVRFDHGSGFQMFGTNIVVDANRILRNRTYTVGAAPSPTGIAGAQFYCTNPTTGAARPYWSNGTNWYDAAGTLLA